MFLTKTDKLHTLWRCKSGVASKMGKVSVSEATQLCLALYLAPGGKRKGLPPSSSSAAGLLPLFSEAEDMAFVMTPISVIFRS